MAEKLASVINKEAAKVTTEKDSGQDVDPKALAEAFVAAAAQVGSPSSSSIPSEAESPPAGSETAVERTDPSVVITGGNEELRAALKANDEAVVEAEQAFKANLHALMVEHEATLAPLFSERNQLTKDLPDFWLRALSNHAIVRDHIMDWDKPVLKYLVDVSFASLDSKEDGFLLRFQFKENPYFSNDCLTKVYRTLDDQFGVMLDSVEASEIHWRSPDKDVTRVRRKRVQNRRGKRVEREVESAQESFFQFFLPLDMDDLEGLADEEMEAREEHMEADFELGSIIRNQIVKHAALFYAGLGEQPKGYEGKLASESEDSDDDESDEDDGEDTKEQPSECASQQQ